MQFRMLSAALAAGLISTASARAAVTAADAWTRATAPGATTGAIFMKLTSTKADSLMEASTPVANVVTVEWEKTDHGKVRMGPIPGGLKLRAGHAVTLHPGSYHIMLEGLKQDLHQGDTVPVHLVFAHEPALDVTAKVMAAKSTGPGMAMGNMKM